MFKHLKETKIVFSIKSKFKQIPNIEKAGQAFSKQEKAAKHQLTFLRLLP